MISLESKIKSILKKHGFVIASELMELQYYSKYQLRRMLASWDNYPACMNIYPTHLLVKRTYEEGM